MNLLTLFPLLVLGLPVCVYAGAWLVFRRKPHVIKRDELP